ncbi:MAG: hypothetical protein OXM57_09120 [bacterium]|nr:hypothetical protein [bacterium]MDE0352842.1 hypothetical protein [bacterium]
METPYDPDYIGARETLLDAVEALGAHSDAVILVGAQATYVHTEDEGASFALSPFTYDADIALDPGLLGATPTILEAMSRAGFRLGKQPGLYKRDDRSQVDLLVPRAVGGPGRRAARLGVHGNRAAMKVHGLEGALVSHARRKIISLTPDADRSCILKVAGPAALLVAKVHKIWERLEGPDARRRAGLAKDAFDIYRLLRAIDTAEMASEFDLLASHEVSSHVSSDALSMFQTLFGTETGTGTGLVVRAVQGLEDPAFITESSVVLSQDLIKATTRP